MTGNVPEAAESEASGGAQAPLRPASVRVERAVPMLGSDTPLASEPGRRLHVLRVADVTGGSLGGAAIAMSVTSELLGRRGHVIDHRYSEHMRTPGPGSCRRVLVPLSILLHILRLRWSGDAPDIVELHEPLGAPYALLRAMTMRRVLPPMVAFSHGLEERGWRAQKGRWERLGRRGALKSRILVPVTLVAQAKVALRFADAVIVLSSDDRDHLLAKRWIRPERIYRINNGVGEDLLTMRRPPRPPDGSVLLLFLGSWIDRKGTPELVQAFARSLLDHPHSRLVVAGAGAHSAQVLECFPAAVRENVHVHRSVTRAEVRDLLGRADIFVLPSWFEGMPLSLLEAAAAGLPIIASDTCGIRDVLRPSDPDRDGGRLVPPHDAVTLHAALHELLGDAELRLALGARARERARAFTWTRAADALEHVYLESASAARTAAARPIIGQLLDKMFRG